MKLHELIGNSLNELEQAKKYDAKKKYLVEEVVLELSVSAIESIDGSFDFKIFNIGTKTTNQQEKENAHKITIKLKPKNTPIVSNKNKL